MNIQWLDEAVFDLKHVYAYIAQNNPTAAKDVAQCILAAVNLLLEHSGIGRPGRISNTRELIVTGTPYIVPYHVRGNTIEILRVLHGAMSWPDKLP